MERIAYPHLAWLLDTPAPANDYGIFRTATVMGQHERVAAPKRFSVIECVDWVNVIALTAAREVVLIRQFRVGAREVCLEIPGGMVDPGEDPQTAAARELLEETGFTAPRWTRLGTVSPNPAIFGNRLHMFLAQDSVRESAARLEGSEVIDVELAPLQETWRRLRDGEINHALVIAAFAHLAALDR